jgi:hypothetical protein
MCGLLVSSKFLVQGREFECLFYTFFLHVELRGHDAKAERLGRVRVSARKTKP